MSVAGADVVRARLPSSMRGSSRALASGDLTTTTRNGLVLLAVGAYFMRSQIPRICSSVTGVVPNVLGVWASVNSRFWAA